MTASVGKESKKEYKMCIHFCVYLTLTQHCKPNTPPINFFINKEKYLSALKYKSRSFITQSGRKTGPRAQRALRFRANEQDPGFPLSPAGTAHRGRAHALWKSHLPPREWPLRRRGSWGCWGNRGPRLIFLNSLWWSPNSPATVVM